MREPTVVLVHGAFADTSGWNGVIERLQTQGVQVTAPANPLRGIAADSAYLAAVLAQIDGPVVAVGHSYGGAVITNAATDAKNVVGLVYVAAFAPEEGEARAGRGVGRRSWRQVDRTQRRGCNRLPDGLHRGDARLIVSPYSSRRRPESRGREVTMRKTAILSSGVLAALAIAAPASADREVFNNWHIHSGLPGARPAAFFPAILGVSLADYQADPSLWAYCPNATDKGLLPNGANGSKDAAGVCMNESTVIHIMTVEPGHSAPEGWSRIPGSSTGYYQLTARG